MREPEGKRDRWRPNHLRKDSGTKSIGGNWEVGEQEGNSNDMVLLGANVTWEHAAAQLASA